MRNIITVANAAFIVVQSAIIMNKDRQNKECDRSHNYIEAGKYTVVLICWLTLCKKTSNFNNYINFI